MIKIAELNFIIPLLIIAGASMVTLLIGLYVKSRFPVMILSLLSVLSAIIITGLNVNRDAVLFSEAIRINVLANSFAIVCYISMLITIIASHNYLEKFSINFSEYYSMLLFALTGMLLMIYANDLIIIFIGLETMSICFYVLAGMMRTKKKSNESALKYLLLGSFMTGFLIFGMSLIYGTTGAINLPKILTTFSMAKSPAFLTGFALFAIGFFFKIGIFPFQSWIPDVYEGAPSIVTGMMSTAGKIAAVGTIAPIISAVNVIDYKLLFAILAVFTMLYGNLIAITQSNLKRLLAYSSIASAGYIMVGISAMDDFANRAISFYLLAYVFMQLGAFIIVAYFEKETEDNRDVKNVTFDEYKGLAKRNPFAAIALSIFLFSLAGIPPFAGFWGKYYLFLSAIKTDLLWLSIVAIILSLLSIYYYLKVIVYMWFKEGDNQRENDKIKIEPLTMTAIVLSILGTLFFGVYPQLFFSFYNIFVK